MSWTFLQQLTKRNQKEQRNLSALCTIAKEGGEEAAQELRKLRLRIWTQQELDVLNYFLQHKKSFHESLLEGRRSWLSQEVSFSGVDFNILWTIPLDEPYFIACILNNGACPQHWLAYSNQGRLCLAFDTYSWLTYEIDIKKGGSYD